MREEIDKLRYLSERHEGDEQVLMEDLYDFMVTISKVVVLAVEKIEETLPQLSKVIPIIEQLESSPMFRMLTGGKRK